MRVVVLEKKDSNELTISKSVAGLLRKNDIGICLNALYNALSKGKGVYENKKVRIYYKHMQ